MNTYLKYTLIVLLVLGTLWATVFFIKSNSKSVIDYNTQKPFITNIEKKTVATGKLIPEDEIEIKPQISGIINQIYLEEGEEVKTGDLIAKIKIVPDEQALNQSKGRLRNAEISLGNVKIEYNRNKALFDKGVISSQDFNNLQLRLDQATQELQNAQSNYQIIRKGSAVGSSSANTNIRATISGTILEIPVEEGDQVIQSNNFNDGTTIAAIADLSKMIFEGKVDEGEVDKLELGMPLEISLGAIQKKKFQANLKFIAPKGVEEAGAVQFRIEADLAIQEDFMIRAGYSANASLVLEKKDDVLVISEALLQFDKKTDEPFVEVLVGDQEFERKNIEIGISDGLNVEIVSGLTERDQVKEWNKTEPIKKGEE